MLKTNFDIKLIEPDHSIMYERHESFHFLHDPLEKSFLLLSESWIAFSRFSMHHVLNIVFEEL